MNTRTFERVDFEKIEEVIISEYGFEWYENDELVKVGSVEDLEEDIAGLIDNGFIETTA